MKVNKEKDSVLDDEIDDSLPDELPDGTVRDDLLVDLDNTSAETLEEPGLAHVPSLEETADLGELELAGESPEKTNDPVRTYLRETGTVSLLTREGEIEVAKRIERGQARVKKALSRAPLVIQEMLKLGVALRAGQGFGAGCADHARLNRY